MSKSLALSSVTLALFCIPCAQAQFVPDTTNAVGSSPLAVYKVGDIDNVNPVNGNLFLDIPLVSFPQRGHDLQLNFHIYANGKQWFVNSLKQTNAISGTSIISGTWGLSATGLGPGVYIGRDQALLFGNDVSTSTFSGGSNASAYTITTQITRFFVQNLDGAKHYYGEYQAQGCQAVSGPCPANSSNNETNFYSASDATGYSPWQSGLLGTSKVSDRHGVTYAIAGAQNLETIADSTGQNSIAATANGWLDSVSRTIPGTVAGVSIGSTLGNTSSQYSFQSMDLTPGVPTSVGTTTCPSGTTVARVWELPSAYAGSQPYYLCYKPFSFATAFDLNQMIFPFWSYQIGDVSSATGGVGPATLLFAIILPNKTSYTFNYDSYLSLSQVVLPTGATINYTWQNLLFVAGPGNATPITRVIAKKQVLPGNGQPVQTWRYQYIGTPVSGTTTVANPSWSIITDPAGNDEEEQLLGTDDAGNSVSGVVVRQVFYTGCGPHDTVSPTCNSGSTPLKTISNTFQSFGSGGSGLPRPSQLEPTTTKITWNLLGGGTKVSQTVRTMVPMYGSCTFWQLDQGATPVQQFTNAPCLSTNQVRSESSYDYGNGSPGALLRTTTTTYFWEAAANVAYLNANFLDLRQKVVVSGPNTTTAETDYAYDVSPNPQGIYGNLSDVTRHLNTGVSPVVRDVYNSQGMLTTRTDQRNYKTNYVYDQTGAFLSSVTYNPTSGVSHVEGFSFDANTGVVLSHTDQNGQATGYSYRDPSTNVVDPLNRLRQINYPATYDDSGTSGSSAAGYTRYNYVDTPGLLSVNQVSLQHAAGASVSHLSKFDELGRVIQTQSSDPSGPDIVDTHYDVMGRVYTISNPYRALSDPTYGVSTYTYDALGRNTLLQESDGNSQLWTYSGPNVTFSDENSNKWQRSFDGLGRLSGVIEPIGVSTTYLIDALGNLRSVTQPGGSGETARTLRSFNYDSLSRLISAYNPESGWTCYGTSNGALPSATNCTPSYDGNDNLMSKTDARGVTISYLYDPLNRLLSKSYSGQTTSASAIAAATLSSCWQYDSATLGKNKLGAMWTQSGTCASAPSPSALYPSRTSIFAYDAMGRISSQTQCILTQCSVPFSGLPTYEYDLVGNLTRQSNGIGTISLASQYDTGNRLQTITSNLSDTTHPPLLFSSAMYNPSGSLSGVVYGNGLNLTRTYDKRLRPLSETDVKGTSQVPGGASSSSVITITGSEQSK
jgi:YD repeat-containing protein